MGAENGQDTEGEWVTFCGGELAGKRPKAMCAACRERLNQAAAGLARRSGRRALLPDRLTGLGAAPAFPEGVLAKPSSNRQATGDGGPLCFQCYRAGLDRARALTAAGQLNTATVERFQSALPFEAVNVPRLERLKAERASARLEGIRGIARFVDKRRHAQIAARHALQQIVAGVRATRAGARPPATPGDPSGERSIEAAIHAAELQLPESWIPFVVAR